MIPELRPRGIGEILDAAVSLYRDRFGLLVRYAALVVVPVQLFLTIVLLSAQPDSFSVTVNGNATPQFDTSRAQIGAIVVVLLAGWVTSALVEAVTARIVADRYVGSAEDPATAARTAARRILTVLVVGLAVGLCQVAGIFLCFVGFFAVRAFFSVAIPAVILERKGVFGAMGRSIELTRTHFWHTLGVVVAAMLLGALVNAGLAAALNIWSAGGASPTAIVITQGLANVVASCITTPFVAAVAVSLYFDLRIRDEAFDVQLAMAAAWIALVAAAVDPDQARRTARDILDGRDYRSSPTPRPFRRQLTWIGDRVHDLFEPIGRLISELPLPIVLSVAAAMLTLVVLFVVRLVRARRSSPDPTRAAVLPMTEAENPDDLERAAEAAERDGRLDEAVRLRFRAGLLRLGDRGAIRYRPSVTTNEVRRVLGSDTFDELARTFDAVAYGGQAATEPDVDTARREWPRVVASTGRKGARR